MWNRFLWTTLESLVSHRCASEPPASNCPRVTSAASLLRAPGPHIGTELMSAPMTRPSSPRMETHRPPWAGRCTPGAGRRRCHQSWKYLAKIWSQALWRAVKKIQRCNYWWHSTAIGKNTTRGRQLLWLWVIFRTHVVQETHQRESGELSGVGSVPGGGWDTGQRVRGHLWPNSRESQRAVESGVTVHPFNR